MDVEEEYMNVEEEYMNVEEEYMKKSTLHKTNNIMRTIYNSVSFLGHIAPFSFSNDDNILDIAINKTKIWKSNSDGLYIVIHGLRGNPCTLGIPISNALKNNDKMVNYDIVIPKVPYAGNCSLDDATTDIYNLVVNYIHICPNKPIHMICASNGCRIGSFIETKLRNVDVNIRITSLAGAYGGSRVVNNYSCVLFPILHADVITDLKLNSKVNNDLRQDMLKPITLGTRYYEFYGTANDWFIPNINDCFPQVNATEVTYHELIEGMDHVSIGYYKNKEILDNSIKWISQLKASNGDSEYVK